MRIVVDSNLETPLQAKLLQNADTTWIFTAQTSKEKIHRLEDTGAHIVVLPDLAGKVDLKAMMVKLAELGINELLVEAGPVLNGALVTAGLVDEIIFYFAPSLLGNSAQAMLALPEIGDLSEKYDLQIFDIRKIGMDVRLVARFMK